MLTQNNFYLTNRAAMGEIIMVQYSNNVLRARDSKS